MTLSPFSRDKYARGEAGARGDDAMAVSPFSLQRGARIGVARGGGLEVMTAACFTCFAFACFACSACRPKVRQPPPRCSALEHLPASLSTMQGAARGEMR